MFEAALRHHQTGLPAEAARLYRQILAIDPGHADSLHGLGVMAYHERRLENAAALIGQAISLKHDVPAFHHNLGLVFGQQGKLAEAVACFQSALLSDPKFSEACSNLGGALRRQGKLAEAVDYCRRAIDLRPDYADAHLDLGAIFFELGNLDEAAACCERALAVKPEHSEAHYNLGIIFSAQGKLDEAAACYRRAFAIRPDYAAAHSNLGSIFFQQGRFDEAAACYVRAIAIRPDNADAQSNLGSIFFERGRLDEAEVCFERALALRPGYAEAHSNLGSIFFKRGKFDEAEACYERVLAIRPNHAEAHFNLGAVLKEKGKPDEAAACYGRAVAIRTDYADAHSNLGAIFFERGKLDEAEASYARALAIKPDHAEAHYGLAFVHLQSGDLDKGWREYEWRRRTKAATAWNFASPLWEGEVLRGRTLLLHCEQGLGDSIQFARYAGLAKAKGGRVLLSCPPDLVRLFTGIEGIDEVFPSDRAPPAVDCHSSLMSLPYLFGTNLATIPSAVPYLQTDPAGAEFWKNRLAFYPGLKVGVAWRGNPAHKNNRNRSMAAASFAACLNVPGVTVVSLQKNAKADEIKALGVTGSVLDAGAQLEDFADTAACVANLDLVITVDTSVCHLAGALGVPVWTLIPLVPDWRWMLDREDSPWYPSMRLFRHPASGDWRPVVARVREALRDIEVCRRQQYSERREI